MEFRRLLAVLASLLVLCVTGPLLAQLPSPVVVASSANPSNLGDPVTFTATVPGTPPITGTVTFQIDGLAQSPVPVASGQAQLTVSNLSEGSHTVVATYSGDGAHEPDQGTLDPPQVVVQSSGVPKTAILALKAGWNPIGLDVNPLTSLTVSSTVVGVCVPDAGGQSTKVFGPVQAGNFRPGQGVWVFAIAPGTLEYSGVVPAHGSLSLTAGWNLVTFPCKAPIPGNQLGGLQVISQVTEVKPDLSTVTVPILTQGVAPGKVYWFFSTAATATITY